MFASALASGRATPNLQVEYTMRYSFHFSLGPYDIQAIKYGNVSSRHGFRNGDTCDRAQDSCWEESYHFLVGLPNGDIAKIYVDPLLNGLSQLQPGEGVNARGLLLSTYRTYTDPIGSISCHLIGNSESRKSYGIELYQSNGELSKAITFSTNTLREAQQADVLDNDLDDFYWSAHKSSCDHFLGMAVRGVSAQQKQGFN